MERIGGNVLEAIWKLVKKFIRVIIPMKEGNKRDASWHWNEEKADKARIILEDILKRYEKASLAYQVYSEALKDGASDAVINKVSNEYGRVESRPYLSEFIGDRDNRKDIVFFHLIKVACDKMKELGKDMKERPDVFLALEKVLMEKIKQQAKEEYKRLKKK